MRSILLVLLYTISLSAYDYHLKPTKVSEDIYCFFGATEEITKENGGNMVNTCYVVTPKGFVVIDSGPTYSYASQAYEEMQKISNIPIKYTITTHDHDDHWLGNSFYKKMGSLLIGPKSYEESVDIGDSTRMERILDKSDYKGTEIVKLDRVVDSEFQFKLGGVEFIIKQLVSKAHTDGDLVVYIPLKHAIFVGDLAFNGRLTSLRDGSVIGSIKAIDKIDEMNADIIITGHGYITDKSATISQKRYLNRLKNEILRAIDNDIEIDKIVSIIELNEFKTLKLYDKLNSRNVFDAYRELELYDEDED